MKMESTSLLDLSQELDLSTPPVGITSVIGPECKHDCRGSGNSNMLQQRLKRTYSDAFRKTDACRSARQDQILECQMSLASLSANLFVGGASGRCSTAPTPKVTYRALLQCCDHRPAFKLRSEPCQLAELTASTRSMSQSPDYHREEDGRSQSPSKLHDSAASVSEDDDNIGVYHFEGYKGIEKFWQIVSGDGGRTEDGSLDLSRAIKHVHQMKVLHLYLDEGWHDDFIDDILTDALTSFGTHSQGGKTLRRLYIHIHGDFLFTKNVYVLPQPIDAVNFSADREWFCEPFFKTLALHKFRRGRHALTINDKLDIEKAGMLNPTVRPKAFIRPLLELSEIAQVTIDGPMETALQREIIQSICVDPEVDSEDDEEQQAEEGLTVGELWDMERIPRIGGQLDESQCADHHGSFHGHDHGDWVFPTDRRNKVVLGWPLESLRA